MKALPKIHKQNIPIRPVIKCINSPNCKVSKFITKIANKLKETKITDETQMASLDVQNLYTNIPIKETLFQFNNKLYEQKERIPMGSPTSGIMSEIFL